MTTLTTAIVTALMQYKMSLDNPVNTEVAKALGITEASVSRIFSTDPEKRTKHLRPATWERMKKLIQPFLPPESMALAESGEAYRVHQSYIPSEMMPELELACAHIDIPVPNVTRALLRAFINTHKQRLEIIWPPVLKTVGTPQ